MSPRGRRCLVVAALAALGVAAATVGAVLALPRMVSALLLADSPMAGENQASVPLTASELEAFRSELRAGRPVRLTAVQLAKLGGPPGAEAPVYELAITDGVLRCRASLAVEEQWLNLDSRVTFAIEHGRVTTAHLLDVRIGRLDLGSTFASWEAAAWVERQIARAGAEDGTLLLRLAAVEEARLEREVLVLALSPDWEEIP